MPDITQWEFWFLFVLWFGAGWLVARGANNGNRDSRQIDEVEPPELFCPRCGYSDRGIVKGHRHLHGGPRGASSGYPAPRVEALSPREGK